MNHSSEYGNIVNKITVLYSIIGHAHTMYTKISEGLNRFRVGFVCRDARYESAKENAHTHTTLFTFPIYRLLASYIII